MRSKTNKNHIYRQREGDLTRSQDYHQQHEEPKRLPVHLHINLLAFFRMHTSYGVIPTYTRTHTPIGGREALKLVHITEKQVTLKLPCIDIQHAPCFVFLSVTKVPNTKIQMQRETNHTAS